MRAASYEGLSVCVQLSTGEAHRPLQASLQVAAPAGFLAMAECSLRTTETLSKSFHVCDTDRM
eukprot:6479399-Amphidinium_carterae.1